MEWVEAVLGKTAKLPCDITPEHKDDRVYMVLWFKENAGKPLYRLVYIFIRLKTKNIFIYSVIIIIYKKKILFHCQSLNQIIK